MKPSLKAKEKAHLLVMGLQSSHSHLHKIKSTCVHQKDQQPVPLKLLGPNLVLYMLCFQKDNNNYYFKTNVLLSLLYR